MRLLVLALAACLVLLTYWHFSPKGRVGGRRLPRHRTRVMRIRLHLRLRPGRGHATVFQLWLRWGRFATFRRSGRSRRSLSMRQRLCYPRAHSILLGRAQRRHALRIPLEEHTLLMAPPRTGKTGWLARVIMRYPGPVVSTTTKHDVFELTSGIRCRIGPVEVFNPQGIGGVPSTFRWNPIHGCLDLATAIRRADGFANAVSTEGTEDGSFWTSTASSHLRSLFHAAALAGGDMRMVARWALGSAEQAEEILARAGAEDMAVDLAQLRGEAAKTAATIRMVMTRALSFMADPLLSLSVLPGESEPEFDIADFLARRGTLYLIAEADYDDSPVAALFAAMAAEIHYQAAQIGQATTGGRLDPPLLMALDEIVQTCPVPLPTWLADSGGKGIQIISVAHGEAQLRTRWKHNGAQAVMDTSGVKVFLPGITDPATLRTASELCGEASYREHGQDHDARHPVLTPDMIRQLPAGFALIVRGGLSPVLARLPMAWKDPAYKHARRHGTAVARLAVAAAPADPTGQTPALADGQAPDVAEILADIERQNYPWS